MIIVSLKSGLGNTMFQYAVFLQLNRMYPKEEIYLDTLYYDFTGYKLELDRVFRIDIDSVDFKKKAIQDERTESYISEELEKLRFWKEFGYKSFVEYEKNDPRHNPQLSFEELPQIYKNLGYGIRIINSLNVNIAEQINNMRNISISESILSRRKRLTINQKIIEYAKLWVKTLYYEDRRKRFLECIKTGHKFDYINLPRIDRFNGIEGNTYLNTYGSPFDLVGIENEIRDTFVFSEPEDDTNKSLIKELRMRESVAIHARVTDFEYGMNSLLEREYYKKAVRYVKRKSKGSLSYYIFSDDIEWCRNNLMSLGITQDSPVRFIDHNKGEQSYRDMQLMQNCKYIVCPNSTFSWWAGYLNSSKDKIVVTPIGTWPGTVSF